MPKARTYILQELGTPVSWFEKAAKGGHVQAMTSLARMHAKGLDGLIPDDQVHVYVLMCV